MNYGKLLEYRYMKSLNTSVIIVLVALALPCLAQGNSFSKTGQHGGTACLPFGYPAPLGQGARRRWIDDLWGDPGPGARHDGRDHLSAGAGHGHMRLVGEMAAEGRPVDKGSFRVRPAP